MVKNMNFQTMYAAILSYSTKEKYVNLCALHGDVHLCLHVNNIFLCIITAEK
jgi:hypothetical protein